MELINHGEQGYASEARDGRNSWAVAATALVTLTVRPAFSTFWQVNKSPWSSNTLWLKLSQIFSCKYSAYFREKEIVMENYVALQMQQEISSRMSTSL